MLFSVTTNVNYWENDTADLTKMPITTFPTSNRSDMPYSKPLFCNQKQNPPDRDPFGIQDGLWPSDHL